MPNPVVHFEISGKDAAALNTFYTSVFGWQTEAMDMPTGKYYMADTKAGGINGGIINAPAGVLPMVSFYISVSDIEAKLKEIEAAGGRTIVPLTVIPDMVTFAMFMDPQNHPIGLVKTDGNPTEHAHAESTDGAVVHFEIVGPEGKGLELQEWYKKVFGWEINNVMPNMVYGIVDTKAGGIGGGVGEAGTGHLTFYIQVSDLDATLKKVEAAGGKTVMPPEDMGMVVFAMFADPDGCLVGLVKGGQG